MRTEGKGRAREGKNLPALQSDPKYANALAFATQARISEATRFVNANTIVDAYLEQLQMLPIEIPYQIPFEKSVKPAPSH